MTSLKAPTSHYYCTRRQAAEAPLRHSFLSDFLRSVEQREISSYFSVANFVCKPVSYPVNTPEASNLM